MKRKIGAFVLAMLLLLGMTSCAGGGAEKVKTSEDNYRNYYEIFVRSFYDSDGDGIGDINGVTAKLDEIKALGFDGIWLMPICSSTTYHKYDVTDYCAIDAEYGSMEDFERLVEECHKRGIRIITDTVLNHSSSQHEWFLTACRYLRSLAEGQEPDETECPYVGYYHFSREKKDNTWSKVAGVDWYYESVFWSEMPDLNYDSESLWKEVEAICDFWMEKGVDGFRLDAVAHFEEGDVTYNNQVLRRLNDYCTAKNPQFYMVGEAWLSEATVAQYYESQIPSFFNFDAAGAEGKIIQTARGTSSAVSFVKSMEKYQTDFSGRNESYIDGVFIANHDMNRAANMVMSDVDTLKMAAGLMMTMQGSTFVYYGEDIGMKSKGTDDENKRLAMYWSEENKAGMTKNPPGADGSVKSSLPAWDEQRKDKDSLLSYYGRATAFRSNNPELARGEVSLLEEYSEGNIAVAKRTYNGTEVYVVYNTSMENAQLNLQGLSGCKLSDSLTLHPKEKVQFKKGQLNIPGRAIVILR